jgi:D-threo-aldose 1-dehydrogenase
MTGDPLPTREIRSIGLRVSELGLGTAPLGNLFEPIFDGEARATINEALDQGIRYFDTAPYYGFGLSERRVGDSLRERIGYAISTKVGRLLLPDPSVDTDDLRHGFRSAMPFKPCFDYSYDGILRSFEDSLHRLGLARVDIVLIHDIGAATHGTTAAAHFEALTLGGGLRALERLRSSGAVRGVGVGANEIEACLRVMDCMHLDVILLAGRYTLLEQHGHEAFFSRCQQTGTAVVIGGPYNSGILATGVKCQELHYDYQKAPANVVERVRQLEAVCDEFNVPLAAAALQFPLAQAAVVSVLPGLNRADRVTETVKLYRTALPKALWDAMRARGLLDVTVPVPR